MARCQSPSRKLRKTERNSIFDIYDEEDRNTLTKTQTEINSGLLELFQELKVRPQAAQPEYEGQYAPPICYQQTFSSDVPTGRSAGD